MLAICGMVGVATAEQFELKDGSIIKGVLTRSSNGACIITRNAGQPFTLGCAEIVRADPPPTPPYLQESPTLRIAGSNTIGAKLMPALLIDYVKSQGASATSDAPRITAADEVVIEPSPVVPHLWSRIELGAHGSATGFLGLAALAANRMPEGANRNSQDAFAYAQTSVNETVIEPRLDTAKLWKSIEVGASSLTSGEPRVVAAAGNRHADGVNRPGLLAFAQGRAAADIAMSSRRVSPNEVRALESLGALDNPASEQVIALDGLAIVINRANRVETLSREQIRQIFSGKITAWEQVGGWPGPISIYARKEGSGTLDTFKDLVLIGAALAPNVIQIEDSRELSSAVANDPRAIGFIGMSYVGEAKAVNISECHLVYPPTIFNAKTEEYPLARRLFLYAPERTTKAVDEFMAYTNSPEAQRVVAKSGFVDLSIEPDFSGDQRRLRPASYSGAERRSRDEELYADMLRSGGRLSVTLRFRSNSAEIIDRLDLDTRAIHDLQRLKEYMRGPQGKGRRIRLVGFTDSLGDYTHNLSLSQGRAKAIANELEEVDVADIIGLGPSFPVACNDSEEARARNRRVEVWITK